LSDELPQKPVLSFEAKVDKDLSTFRVFFSIATFLLTVVAFVIGFPALEDAGKKIGLGSLAVGLPFAIDLGMVTLLLWSMWNRGTMHRSWPPMIPAVVLLLLSSWLQYIHAIELVASIESEIARTGLIILACSLPLLLALSAGVFESVTFAPLIDRARRRTQMLLAQQKMDDELWTIQMEENRRRMELEATLKRNRMELESKTELKILEAEAEAAARALKSGKVMKPIAAPSPQSPQVSSPMPALASAPVIPTAPRPVADDGALAVAVKAVLAGELSQRSAAETYGVTRSTLRRRLEAIENAKANEETAAADTE